MPQPSVSCHYWPDWDVHLACQSKVYECVTSKEERNIGREQSGIVLIYQNLKTFSRSLSLCNSQILPQIQPAINLSMIMRWSLLCFTLSFYLLLVKGFGIVPMCSSQMERMFNTTRIPGIETGATRPQRVNMCLHPMLCYVQCYLLSLLSLIFSSTLFWVSQRFSCK